MGMGEKIKVARKALGLTQQQLAGDQFTKGYISQIEKETVLPSMKVLHVIAERLGKPMAYFLDEGDHHYRFLESQLIKGENLYHEQRYKEAKYLFQQVVQGLWEKSGFVYAQGLLNLGKACFFLGQYEESMEAIENSIVQFKDLLLYEKLADAYFFKGINFFNQRHYGDAIHFFEKTLGLIEDKSLSMVSHKAKCHLNIATAFMNEGKLGKALQVFERTASFCKKERVVEPLLDCFVRMGYIHYQFDRLALAKEYIINAHSLNRIFDIHMLWVEIYNILAMILFKEGRKGQAMGLLNRSMDACQGMEYEWGYYANIIDRMTILLEAEQLDKVEGDILAYREKIKALKDPKLYYLLMGQLARLYGLRGDREKSIDQYKQTIDHFIGLGMKWEAYQYSQELANILIATDPRDAQRYYEMSLKYFREITG